MIIRILLSAFALIAGIFLMYASKNEQKIDIAGAERLGALVKYKGYVENDENLKLIRERISFEWKLAGGAFMVISVVFLIASLAGMF